MTLRYISGDATQPQGEESKLLVHVCNDIGAGGRGFVLAPGRRFPETERAYRQWFADETSRPFSLGEVQFPLFDEDAALASQIARDPAPEGLTRAEARLDQLLALGFVIRREGGGIDREVLLGIEGDTASFRPLNIEEEPL